MNAVNTVNSEPPRTQGIGASEAAAAVGLSKWQTPVELYLEKIGERERDIDAEALHLAMGKALEPVVIERFTRRTGLSVTSQQRRVRDPVWPVRWATVDGITSEGGLLEAKTTAIVDPREWGEEYQDDAVPMQYYLQAQHSMACTGLAHAWMPVLVLNRRFLVYRVRRDDELIERLTLAEQKFWACVETRTPPDPINVDDASLLWPQDSGKAIVADADMVIAVAQLKSHKACIKETEGAIDDLMLRVKSFMGENAVLTNASGTPLVTWKTARPSHVFDRDSFRFDHPDLYRKYETERAGSRRLLVK